MITEERLKELIEQNKDIWSVSNETYIELDKLYRRRVVTQLLLTEDYNIADEYVELHHKGGESPFSQHWFEKIALKDLYETKEQAEWARDFQRIKRTEYLDLPSWEELQPKIKDLEVNHGYLIAFNSRFAMEYENSFIDQIVLYQNQPPYESYNWNADKESYIEACEMAKRLFLGKEE